MSIESLDSKGRTLQLVLFIGRKGTSYANEMERAGFSKPHVYKTLARLEAAGILTSSLERMRGRGGVKVVYGLTPLGAEVFSLISELDALFGGQRSSVNHSKR